ncbi:MAG: hypothetical protein M0T77_09375 [Actinomycetota bacterium]|nr:hypothetical protein [Actinomycetota bacterium]
MLADELSPLLDHLEQSGITRGVAARVVEEVMAYFSETAEEFVRRRHRELQRAGVTNSRSLALIAQELVQRRVAGPALSERQVRRLIYG